MVSFKVFSPFVCNPVPLDVSFDKGGGLLSVSVEHVSVSCFGYSRFLLGVTAPREAREAFNASESILFEYGSQLEGPPIKLLVLPSLLLFLSRLDDWVSISMSLL